MVQLRPIHLSTIRLTELASNRRQTVESFAKNDKKKHFLKHGAQNLLASNIGIALPGTECFRVSTFNIEVSILFVMTLITPKVAFCV